MNGPLRKRPSLKREDGAAGDLARRFPMQPAVFHDGTYGLTADDRAAVEAGRSLFIRGGALAKAEAVCRYSTAAETFWYWLAAEDQPSVISDLLLPNQTATSCHCAVDSRDVLRANRQARKHGFIIVGGGHNHAHHGLFSSGTDKLQAEQFASEAVGMILQDVQRFPGRADKRTALRDGGQMVDVSFPGNSFTRGVVFAKTAPESVLDDLACTLIQSRRRSLHCFSTSNAGGHLFPLLETEFCPACQARADTHILADRVTVHVIGRIAIPGATLAELQAEIRVKVSSLSGKGIVLRAANEVPWGCTPGGKTAAADGAGSAVAAPPVGGIPPYELWLDCRFLGRIPAAVLEEAAAKFPPLAEALGWQPHPYRGPDAADTNGRGTDP